MFQDFSISKRKIRAQKHFQSVTDPEFFLFAVIRKNARSPASIICLPGVFPFQMSYPQSFCITNVRLSRSSWLKLLVIPVWVLRRRVSNRFDHTERPRFLLQFLHHSALKAPFISKIKQVLKFITFFQSESSKRHFIGYPAALIHIVGIIGTEIAPIPVIHKERMAMVIVKFESGQNRFTQRTKGFLLADLNVPVTASYSTPCLLRYCSSRRMSIRWSRINRCAFVP